MQTIEQLAESLGVTETAAYGLVTFLKAKDAITVTDAPSNGKRGRRAKLYRFNDNTMRTLSESGVLLLCATDADPTAIAKRMEIREPRQEFPCISETEMIGPLG